MHFSDRTFHYLNEEKIYCFFKELILFSSQGHVLINVLILVPKMFNQDDDVEVLTPAERLELLLQKISQDMKAGRLSAACAALKKIRENQAHYNLIRNSPTLKSQYDFLNQRC